MHYISILQGTHPGLVSMKEIQKYLHGIGEYQK